MWIIEKPGAVANIHMTAGYLILSSLGAGVVVDVYASDGVIVRVASGAGTLNVHGGARVTLDVGVTTVVTQDGQLRDLVGAPAVTVSADIASVKTDTGTTLPARLAGIEGAGFVSATDGLVPIRTGAENGLAEVMAQQPRVARKTITMTNPGSATYAAFTVTGAVEVKATG